MIDERSEDRGWAEHYAVQAERERQERRIAAMRKYKECKNCAGTGTQPLSDDECRECGGQGQIEFTVPDPDKFTVTVLKHDDDHVFGDIVAFEIKDNCYCMIDDSDQRFIVPMSSDIMWIETVKQ